MQKKLDALAMVGNNYLITQAYHQSTHTKIQDWTECKHIYHLTNQASASHHSCNVGVATPMFLMSKILAGSENLGIQVSHDESRIFQKKNNSLYIMREETEH